MRNFNNNRTVDLNGYLPDILKNVREFKAIMDAENPIIWDIWQAAEDLMNDQFITEATENGVAMREKMLGINPFATDTLEDRKFRLLSRYMEDIPYTRRSLESFLASLCGEDGYRITYKTNDFTVNVRVELTAKRQVDSVDELLERVLPYNMIYTVELLYNQWQTVKPFTWDQMKALTWRDVKEEVLNAGNN